MIAARILVVAAGAAGAAVSGAALVREVLLAAREDVVWAIPDWMTWLTAEPEGLRATVGAVISGLAALACLVLAVRLVRRRSAALRRLDLGDADTAVAVESSTLDRMVVTALRRRLPVVEAAKVALFQSAEDYQARVQVHLRACCDLLALHGQVAEVVREELRRAAGLTVTTVDVEIEKLEGKRKGGT